MSFRITHGSFFSYNLTNLLYRNNMTYLEFNELTQLVCAVLFDKFLHYIYDNVFIMNRTYERYAFS